MFERFTDRARRVVVLAQEEARLLGHNYIGTEHILLGLVHEGDGVAARALAVCHVSLDDVRSEVEAVIGQGGTPPSGHIPFTPRAKKALELSLREALQLGHNYIGTEHVLLGLLREGEGVAAQVLVALGLELSQVRDVIRALTDGEEPEPPLRTAGRPQRNPARDFVSVTGGGPRLATCSFCGAPSPMSGRLFTGASGALICERCAHAIVAQATAPIAPFGGPPPGAGRGVFGWSGSSSVRPEQPLDVEELVARVVPTGSPPEDEAAARAEIGHAFRHQSDRTADGRGLVHVHDADDLVPYVEEVRRRFGAYSGRSEMRVDAVAFVDATEAVVWRSVYVDGGPVEPYRQREGRVVLVDGQWLITRSTMVESLSFAGMFVPPRDGESPEA